MLAGQWPIWYITVWIVDRRKGKVEGMIDGVDASGRGGCLAARAMDRDKLDEISTSVSTGKSTGCRKADCMLAIVHSAWLQ